MTISPTTEKDIPFITEAIFAAVKSGTETFSFSVLFGMGEEELKPLFHAMLEEDVQGQDLCYSDYLLAKDENGAYAGACCAWIEGENGDSQLLKGSVLGYYIPKESLQKAAEKNSLMDEVKIHRQAGALQIESVYTKREFRGKGIAGKLIRQLVANHKARVPELETVQIILAKDNGSAWKAYEKLGFKLAEEKTCANPEILEFFPTQTMILMQAPVQAFL